MRLLGIGSVTFQLSDSPEIKTNASHQGGGGWCADEARTAQPCPPGLGPLPMGELPLPKGARVLLSELGF